METAKWLFQITTSNPNCARVQRLERKWAKALEWYDYEKAFAEKGETIALERQLYVKMPMTNGSRQTVLTSERITSSTNGLRNKEETKMWNAKNAMLKNIIAIKYEQLTSYKKLYHIKGTLNKYEGLYITGVIDQLTNEIETLQDLLRSYKELDNANGGQIK